MSEALSSAMGGAARGDQEKVGEALSSAGSALQVARAQPQLTAGAGARAEGEPQYVPSPRTLRYRRHFRKWWGQHVLRVALCLLAGLAALRARPRAYRTVYRAPRQQKSVTNHNDVDETYEKNHL